METGCRKESNIVELCEVFWERECDMDVWCHHIGCCIEYGRNWIVEVRKSNFDNLFKHNYIQSVTTIN